MFSRMDARKVLFWIGRRNKVNAGKMEIYLRSDVSLFVQF